MGRDDWHAPTPFGPAGWKMVRKDRTGSIIVTEGEDEWIHASIAWTDRLPTYEELGQLHRAVWGDGFAYQQFVPSEFHVNIHAYALHLWGRADGAPCMPYASGGSV